jgi:hypothetical protein
MAITSLDRTSSFGIEYDYIIDGSFRRNFSHLDEFEIMEKNPL